MPSRKIRRSPLSQYIGADEDSFSESSSTFTADSAKSSSKRPHYNVKFNLKQNIKYTRPPLEEKELERRWYTSKDTDKMKERSFAKAREMGKQDQNTRGKNNLHAQLGKLLDVCCKAKDDNGKNLLKKKDFAKLVESLSVERVGLETAINTDIMADKLNRRYNILRRVIQQGSGSGATLHDLMRGPVDEEELGRISEKYSLVSRLLARHLALAAAQASACWFY